MKIALISEHASPLATPGGVDCGGQNVYVSHVGAEADRIIAERPEDREDRLARLWRAAGLRRAFGQRGLRRVRRHFTWRLVAAELARVYREVAQPFAQPMADMRVQA